MNAEELNRKAIQASELFLERKGYEILDSNWESEAGSADIVARDESTIVFFEVNSRAGTDAGFPRMSDTEAKRDRFERVAIAYMTSHNVTDASIRFDIISMVVVGENRAMLLHHVEARRRQGIPDRPQLDLDEKEAEIVVGVLVEPFYGLSVLVAGARDHPHDHFGAFPGGVGDDLAQVVVVGVFELVLDDHLATHAGFLGVDVEIERPNGRLSFYELELNGDGRAQHGEVGLLGEPFGEVERLMRPYVAQLDLFKRIQVVFHRGSHRITINQYFAPESKRPTRCRCPNAFPIAPREGSSRMNPF